MVSRDRELKNDRQDIADTFADFYECLYFCDAERLGDHVWKHGSCEEVPALSNSEVEAVLKVMANNKASDDSGLVVEMLQEGSGFLIDITVELFNEILKPEPLEGVASQGII